MRVSPVSFSNNFNTKFGKFRNKESKDLTRKILTADPSKIGYKNYQDELLEQAELFLAKLEEQVSKEAIDKFYELVKPINGCRWYDKNPVISRTVEILRVVPPDVQKKAAQMFIDTLKKNGIDIEE